MPLPYDPAEALAHLAAADPTLGTHIARTGPLTLEPTGLPDLFLGLLRSIVYQQLSGKAAATIYGRVEALFGDRRPSPGALLDLPDETLRGAGLSRAKLAAARDLAAKILDGTLPPTDALAALPDSALVDRLTQVRGIGPWTVQMLLIFDLGRPDVLPATDYGVQKGFQRLYGGDALPAPKALLAYGDRWRPFRSVASWYLWRAADTGGGA